VSLNRLKKEDNGGQLFGHLVIKTLLKKYKEGLEQVLGNTHQSEHTPYILLQSSLHFDLGLFINAYNQRNNWITMSSVWFRQPF
jgi:hypothetical protein